MSPLKQLSFNLCLQDDITFADFYGQANREVLDWLRALEPNPNGKFTYLWGATGSGCSHLLIACCHKFSNLGLRAVYLPLQDLNDLSPAVLEDLDKVALLCLDNIEMICGNMQWEEALFHYMKKMQEQGSNLLVAAHSAPRSLVTRLPDLQSRLAGGVVFQVHGLDDEQKIVALQTKAELRGLLLARQVAIFLLNHYERDTSSLFNSLDILDKSALQAQRRLTIPFVKQVLSRK